MQQCKNCGRTLTEAALALGYCPSCGTLVDPAAPSTPTPLAVSQPVVNTPLPPPESKADNLTTPQPPSSALQPAPLISPPVQLEPAASPPPPSITRTVQPRNNAGLIVAIIAILLLISATGGTLAYVGQQGQGPFAGYFGKTTVIIAATATIIPTATVAPTQTVAPTATPLPSVPPAPVGYQRFISTSKLYGLNYPALWTTNDIPGNAIDSTGFISSDQSEFFQVSETTSLVTTTDVSQYLTTFVNNDSGSNFQLTAPAQPFSTGSNTWTEAKGTYTANGKSYSVVGLAINHETHGYIVVYSAQVAAFKTVAGSTFAQMIGSFTFLS